MAGPKKQTPPPIDRPLSRAYLRNFTGWSTAYPPGLSDPTSCRQMENMFVTRDKGLSVRPGLRYMSYLDTPDVDPLNNDVPGVAFDRPLVGELEPFYLTGGTKALLFAVREVDQSVGFRVLIMDRPDKTVFSLEEAGFFIPQGTATLNFSSATKHVTYLQIDNRILAMSDAGELLRYFTVGTERVAKALSPITTPKWEDADKPVIVHPSSNWVLKLAYSLRRNELLNPSFEAGFAHWSKGSTTFWALDRSKGRAANRNALVLWTAPLRTNYAMSPLHNVSATGTAGWHSGKGDPVIDKDGDWMRVYDKGGKDVFLAHSAKCAGIEEGKRYKLAFNFELSSDAQVRARLQFYRNNGSEIGDPIKFFPDKKDGRWESPGIEAPNNATSVRIYLGADSTDKKASWAKFKHVMLCRANESTDFFSGADGGAYQWFGTVNASSSLYWPPQDITIAASRVPVDPGSAVTGSLYVRGMDEQGNSVARDVFLDCFVNDKHGAHVAHNRSSTLQTSNTWARLDTTISADARTVAGNIQVTIKNVAPGDRIHLDDGMLEAKATLGTYFDGATPSTTDTVYSWQNPQKQHLSPSLRTFTTNPTAIPGANNPAAADSLISSDATKNTFKMGFFYAFENEIGESAPSKIVEVRMMRPQSNWLWKSPTQDASNEPNGAVTDVADLCADQLVASIPKAVYDAALSNGAVRWHLYTFAWSDQDPVPVEATLAGTRELYPDRVSRLTNQAMPYEKGGWINITPSRKFTTDSQALPTATNRVNYSAPPRARNGLVAGDRMIVVGDADEPATIKWTTNRPGMYTNFTAHKGGGAKTLSSGNLNLPASVQLWQNPQSVDTLTILCLGSDGTSTCYYMSPADVTSQSSSTQVMGFEETTNTPGTMAPYGALVHNNALFRPIDRALLKSTAQNYNINHKTLSDDIANMWEELQEKRWIMSAVHDNRLYFLVNNPRGEPVEDGCSGNEIWVYDTAGGESGTWARFLIQASALQVIDYGARVYVGVIRPDGLFYLDYDARQDDYVLDDGTVGRRHIPWSFEMNTQGANKAHDAWAHLQQIVLTLGDFQGVMEYGIRAKTINGTAINTFKRFSDFLGSDVEGLSWEAQDALSVRRDLMQWYFYARSVDGEPSWGQFNTVQYRYTPVSVNVGYEQGSVETFEYSRNVVRGNDALYRNGIPEPAQDFGRM